MKKSTLAAIITLALIGVIVGVLIIVLAQQEVLSTVIRITFIIVGIITVIANIPGIISGIVNIKTTPGLVELIISAVGAAFGCALIFSQNIVVSIIAAVYLIVIPILNLIFSKDRKQQFRTELPKIILGVIVAILSPGTMADGALKVVSILFTVAGAALILLSVVFGVVMTIRVARAKDFKSATVIYADTDGNGTIDTVFKDTTGDGVIDTAINIEIEDDQDDSNS